jgi:hypothetical protein
MLQLQVTIMLLVNLAARVFLLILALKVINQMQYPIISIIPPPPPSTSFELRFCFIGSVCFMVSTFLLNVQYTQYDYVIVG